MLRITTLPQPHPIPTLLRLRLATRTLAEPSKSTLLPLLKAAPISKMPFKFTLWESQLMPPTGADTLQEFSATAEETSTTTSSSLASPPPTTESRTLGEAPGENQDSSVLLLETPAVSATTSLHGSLDLSKIIQTSTYSLTLSFSISFKSTIMILV